MDSSGLGESMQVVSVLINGIPVAFRIAGGITKSSVTTIKVMAKAIRFMCYDSRYQKTVGKTNVKNLLVKSGNNTTMGQVPTEIMNSPKFKKTMKKYGILWSEMPDLNVKDGVSQIMYATSAAPRMEEIYQWIVKEMGEAYNQKIGEITPEEYEATGQGHAEEILDEKIKEIEDKHPKLVEAAKLLEKKEFPLIKIDEQKEEVSSLIKTIYKNERMNQENVIYLYFGQDQVYDETAKDIRVSNQYEQGSYIKIDKEDLVVNESGSYVAVLNKDKDIIIYNKNGEQDKIKARHLSQYASKAKDVKPVTKPVKKPKKKTVKTGITKLRKNG